MVTAPVLATTIQLTTALSQMVLTTMSTTTKATKTTHDTGRFGEVIDVKAPDGKGLRFAKDGKFIGFLEP